MGPWLWLCVGYFSCHCVKILAHGEGFSLLTIPAVVGRPGRGNGLVCGGRSLCQNALQSLKRAASCGVLADGVLVSFTLIWGATSEGSGDLGAVGPVIMSESPPHVLAEPAETVFLQASTRGQGH